MLVLSRKDGEQIVIGDNIVLTVVEIKGNRVRLGVEAPRDVSITRPDAKSQTGPAKPPAKPIEVEIELKSEPERAA